MLARFVQHSVFMVYIGRVSALNLRVNRVWFGWDMGHGEAPKRKLEETYINVEQLRFADAK